MRTQATGLALPGSDLDIVVLGAGDTLERAGSGFSLSQVRVCVCVCVCLCACPLSPQRELLSRVYNQPPVTSVS